MSEIFTFTDDSTDFDGLKKKGVDAVMIKYSSKISKNIKKASLSGMKIMIEMPCSTKDAVKIIKPLAGRLVIEDGEIEYVSKRNIKNTIRKIGDLISEITGFVIPVPKVNGVLWSDELKEDCPFEIDELYDLFDEEREISHIRSRYYIWAQKYLCEKFILPQNQFLKSLGKASVLYLGKSELQYELIRKHINIKLLKSIGISIGISCEMEAVETEFQLGTKDFIFGEISCEKISLKRSPRDVLLVKPMRGVMERYVETGKINRIETPALSGAIEGVYFCDMLKRKGYSFDVADEFVFSTKKKFAKYKDILICESCLFTDEEMAKINKLSKNGVRINSQELISVLSKQGEE